MCFINDQEVCEQPAVLGEWVWQHTCRAEGVCSAPTGPAMLVFPVASNGFRLHIIIKGLRSQQGFLLSFLAGSEQC